MAGLQFPQLGNALLAGSQAAYSMQRGRREADEYQRQQEARQHIEPAIRGDVGAFGKLAAGDPAAAASVAQALARMDAATLAKAKVATDYTTGATTALLALPESAREAGYQQTRAEAQAKGMDISRWPTNYDANWVTRNHVIGIGAQTWFNQQQQNQRHATPAGGAPTVVDMPGGGGVPQGDDSSSGSPSGYRPPVGNTRAAGAISGIESGGRYDAVGPVANQKGNRAYGKYQIMDFNVGPWTQEFVGRAMTPQEFVADPQAQERVFEGKFGQYVQKYGSAEAAARAWFAGEGGMNNPNARDVLGTSVASYGQKFSNAYGGGNALAPQTGGGASYGVPGPVAAPPTSPLEGRMPSFNTAQMPGAPSNLIPPGPPPAQMPEYGGIPQGGDPPADGSGTPLPPRPAGAERPAEPGVRGGFLDRDPVSMGYKPVGVMKNGVVQQAVENGYFVYYDPRTGGVKTGARVYYHPKDDVEKLKGEAEAKRKAENPHAVAGPFPNTSIQGTALNMAIADGVITKRQASDLALGKVVKLDDGTTLYFTPQGLLAAGAAGGQVSPVGAPPANGTAPAGAAPPAATAPPVPTGAVPLGAPKPPTMTEGQSASATYADRVHKADAIIQKVGTAGLETKGKLLEAVPFGAGNYLQDENYQLYEQARRDFINAVLRRESGAVISDEEFANANIQYFPRPGDSEAVLKQKAENRKTTIGGISRAAGATYKPPAQTAPASGGDNAKLLDEAKQAIAKGAPRDKVIERLRSMGVKDEP